MEHLVGADLGAVLSRRGALPVGLAVECIMQACEALAEAHALGIIHRDLKPANLFLTESVDGSPCIKVLDFGVSRMIRRTALSTLTDPGTVLGTPSYMAPEQMEGSESLDARSDIWALGAILYELLTARPAYSGESLPQIFMKIMRAKHPPRARSARLDVPPELDAVIAKCLAIEPERRYRTVADLAWALAELGTPHARDSAHRISRVLDNRSAGAGAARASPLLDPASTTRSLIRAPRRRRAVVVATSALVLSAAGAFGVLAAQRAIASEPGAAAAHHAAPTASVGEDAAVVIAPRERPTAGTRGEGTLRIVGSSAIPPQSARPLDERAPRAKDAIVDPDPGGRD
jgi:serine/threonine-protein kinase